jgi:hypothetical protein
MIGSPSLPVMPRPVPHETNASRERVVARLSGSLGLSAAAVEEALCLPHPATGAA